MSGRLHADVALVVGASSGIGRAVARKFGAEGANVVVAARSLDRLETTAEGIREAGGSAIAVECDLTDRSSVDTAVDATTEAFGRVDVAFNSAGTITRGPITEIDEADMERVVDVNLQGPMRLARAVLPELIAAGGTLINVSSEAGERGIENLPAYCASKGGLNTLTRQLAVEFGPEGVNVNAIAPGTTKTELNETVRQADPEWVERRREDIPIGRLNDPEDVSELAVYLASDAAETVNGTVVNIDGGTTAR
jgi:NAD(P)-dependent dehydrogenase (short-subunit alcohol dehydrogenase family)